MSYENYPLALEKTGGKSRSTYFKFAFEYTFEKEYRFWSSEYKYADDISRIYRFKKGDSVTVCLTESALKKIYSKTFFNNYFNEIKSKVTCNFYYISSFLYNFEICII